MTRTGVRASHAPGSFPVLALAACLAVGAGCAREAGLRRPEIRYGEHECDHCRMIVSEERTAAVALFEGEAYRFDDLECVSRWAAGRDVAVERVWVHDAVTLTWLPAGQAVYARATGVITPMGSGWLAFSDAEGFEATEAEPGAAVA